MHILIINQQSPFAWQLAQSLAPATYGATLRVLPIEEVEPGHLMQATHIVLVGISMPDIRLVNWVQQYASEKRFLGINSGAMAIAQAFGASPLPLAVPAIAEQRSTVVAGASTPLFKGIPREFQACYYQAWDLPNKLPNYLSSTAKDKSGKIAAFKHVRFACEGILFHPASFGTEYGAAILGNWLMS